MKLLFDENLSDRIVSKVLDLYPDSTHVKQLGLRHTDDSAIWSFAAQHGFTIVSKDSDFHQRSLVYKHPPKFIYLRVGNCTTQRIIDILRVNIITLNAFDSNAMASILVLQ